MDDEPGLLQLYQDELSEEGYEVILAKDGQEGLIKCEEECPDVVIMDIRMPQMGGIETLTAVLGKDHQMPVILNTSYPQYRDNFMTWGAEAYVTKSNEISWFDWGLLDKHPDIRRFVKQLISFRLDATEERGLEPE
jgi:DNA-binding response OmpR family regulator